MSDLLSKQVIDDVEALVYLYSDYRAVDRALHAYVESRGLLPGQACSRESVVSSDIRRLNTNISKESADEFAQKILSTQDISLGLEVLRNALNHEDEE